jgi:short-subunit dehydrogenase
MGQQSPLLQHRCALITGASKGIGSAVAELFASEGAALVLVGRSEDSLQQVR